MQDQPSSALTRVIRSLIKAIMHFFTGKTEIERAARAFNLLSLQISIAKSKTLATFRGQNCNWEKPFNVDIAEQLCALKAISNEDSKFRVSIQFRVLYDWKHSVYIIDQLRSQKYDSSSPSHEGMLLQIWKRLRPKTELTARKSDQWIELGFQADDPATDFRGSGLLGLMNLHSWVGTQEGRGCFKVADTKGTDYFFASCSIFLTMLTFQIVKQGLVGPNYWFQRSEDSIFSAFQKIFNIIFEQFALYWLQVPQKSFMQFNMNLLAFSKLIKTQLSSKINRRLANQSSRQ